MENIDDLVKRAQKLLSEKNASSESESKALVLRRDSPPAGVSAVPQRPLPPATRRLSGLLLSGGQSLLALPPVIELPRYCAVYDGEMWLARYILLLNGAYEFNTGIELTKQQRSRYAPENAITLPEGFESDVERCACCGAWTRDGARGAVWCPRHNGGRGGRVCYGRTSRSGFFMCCDSCGMSGQLTHYEGERIGLLPGSRGGNMGSL